MRNKIFKLNKTTKTLGNIFPALLIFTPVVAFAGTISQSTSVPQDFSADAEYVINKDVTISSAGSESAVSVTGINVTSTTNKGNISGKGNGLDINTGAQRVIIHNESGATISSTTANAVNVQSMLGDLNNDGNITGTENGVFVSESSSAVNIANTDTGIIRGNTGLSSQIGVGINNSGKITGTNGDGISLSDGNTKIINTGTLEGTQYGINVTGDAANLLI
uniref:hypothetical protein n=1 Tax=Enterobacter kobei TaxID=208224 RepID=UPI002814CCEB|nr:hypothetical protein [Enterobacter kobei]